MPDTAQETVAAHARTRRSVAGSRRIAPCDQAPARLTRSRGCVAPRTSLSMRARGCARGRTRSLVGAGPPATRPRLAKNFQGEGRLVTPFPIRVRGRAREGMWRAGPSGPHAIRADRVVGVLRGRGGATRSRVAGARVSSSLPQPEASNLPGFSTRSALRPAASNGRARAHLLARRSPFARSGRQGGSS